MLIWYSSPGTGLQWYLMASYAYYHLDNNIMADVEYDALARWLYLQWDDFEHQHKHLVKKSDLASTSSLFDLPEDKYPGMVKSATMYLLYCIKKDPDYAYTLKGNTNG